ncbi:MAG: protein DpdJ [Chloroflexi bacterium]|nr:protein DpdJ [Chloroflexota bacterium]
MNARATEQQLDQLLLAIEQREARSLRWGSTNAALLEDDLVALASQYVNADSEEAAAELLDRRLLFQVPTPGGGISYRSRFGEGVRLMASLRQLFPGRPWEAAPSLVADFRVDLRERRFPKRDQPANEVFDRLAGNLNWTSQDVAVATALVSGLRLSAFQERTAEAVLRPAVEGRGVVIAAGTGAGKTLAYYLPVIVRIAREVRANAHWTKAISVYPRNELLKDQFAEVLRYVRRLNDILSCPVAIGALFGPTPNDASINSIKQKWDAFPSRGTTLGYICPFATCPECDSRLLWLRSDLAMKREALTCERKVGHKHSCDFETDPTQVLLTRRAVRQTPPDLLFVTAEMLNQRMSDPATRGALGLGVPPKHRPLFMLLDEAHTYEGIAGAQAAMVFRRWKHGISAPVRWVGLSATLREGPAFFSQLTGLLESAVEEVSPADDEHETLAAEYQLILRGDPLSQASLLSTSIQTSFLLTRLLDPEDAPSHGRVGHRTFAFTDDLDVTNRLFHDLRDAERQRLARQRSVDQAKGQHAFSSGQQWRIVEEIGWDLSLPLTVSRTSSQDAGVSASSQLVVATSSLEVGFNDDRVGAIVQHKSPRRASSFVQRKGRAGRTRRMRPWTVTVLSDYGRDRLTYQSYDRLFDPIVDPLQLPIKNGYVKRIHAGFAFVDWLAVRSESPGWWWWTINGPGRNRSDETQRRQLTAVIEKLLDRDPAELALLRRHLRGALDLDDADLDAVLWQPPRSLMLEVLPTLSRRLATGWKTVNPKGPAGTSDGLSDSPYPRPLPEFLPPNLFSDLNLPEVSIRGNEIGSDATLLVEQALRHLPPGRVTRRFAPGFAGTYHWVPVPIDQTTQCELPISEFVPRSQAVAEVTVEINGSSHELTVYRPWEISVANAPTSKLSQGGGNVLPSSNSRYVWHSQIMPQGAPLSIEATHDPVWSKFVDRLEFFLHDQRSPLTVRRFAAEAVAELRLRERGGHGTGPVDHTLRVLLRDPEDPSRYAAVGYEAEVDGMTVCFRRLDRSDIVDRAESASSLPVWRTAYVRELVRQDQELPTQPGSFLRDWLFDLYMATVVKTAIDLEIHASAANQLLRSDTYLGEFDRLLRGFLHLERQAERPEEASDSESDLGGDADGGDGGNGTSSIRDSRLRDRLLGLLADEAIRSRLSDLFQECWSPDTTQWETWLDSALNTTLAEAARSAALSTAPEHVSEESVLLDVVREETEGSGQAHEAWITESSIGGTGVIEAIAAEYAAEPRAFFRALEFELLPGEFELTSLDLDTTVRLATVDDELREAVAEARDARSHDERESRMRELASCLQSRGITPGHTQLVSLNQRLLRPGLTDDAYLLIHGLVTLWHEIEGTHGIGLDLRVFCSVVVNSAELGPELTAGTLAQFLEDRAGNSLSPAERAGVLMGLLWPRAHEARRHSLQSWSPFREAGFCDPALVRELLLTERVQEIHLAEPNAREASIEALAQSGVIRFRAGADELGEMQTLLFRLVGEAVDVGFLQLYPSIEQLRRQGRDYVATIVLRGVV